MGNMAANRDLADAYLHWFAVVRGRSPTSVESYRHVLGVWVDFCGSVSFGDVTAEMVESFTVRPRRARHIGRPATRRRDLGVLSSFYRWLCASEPSCRNPTLLVGAPAVHNQKPKALDDDVWRRVWAVALPVERAWLGLGFFTGLRASELTSIKVGHYSPRDARIVGFQRKGGDEGEIMCGQMAKLFSTRQRLLLPDCAEWLGPLSELAASRDPADTLIPWRDCRSHGPATTRRFGLVDGDVAPSVVGNRVKRVLKRAGLHPNLFTPHALRHSAIANWLDMGLPLHIVQKLANHSSPAVTQRYGRATEQMLNEWLGNNGFGNNS